MQIDGIDKLTKEATKRETREDIYSHASLPTLPLSPFPFPSPSQFLSKRRRLDTQNPTSVPLPLRQHQHPPLTVAIFSRPAVPGLGLRFRALVRRRYHVGGRADSDYIYVISEEAFFWVASAFCAGLGCLWIIERRLRTGMNTHFHHP